MTRVRYLQKFSQTKFSSNDLIVIDKKLLRFPIVRKKLRSQKIYAVNSGEGLKELRNFPSHMEKILRLSHLLSPKELRIVAIGGGSVGDFAGFVASVLKRGVSLVQVPSTWLSALDSSHGGKTALNAAGTKNQVGTFYSASEVWVCRDLLSLQPPALTRDAYGELTKTALLDSKLARSPLWKESVSSDIFWKYLRQGISYKYQIVKKDPFEEKGIRTLLNFGHTMGHAFEVLNRWPHGKAVFYGITFDLLWSRQMGFLSAEQLNKITSSNIWQELFDPNEYLRALQLQKKQIMKLIANDKKKVSQKLIRQVFLKAPGRPLVKSVPLESLVKEYERQKKYFN